MEVIMFLLTLAYSYLSGSIPVGYAVGKVFKGIDIRDYGSGCIGTANAERVLGKKLSFLVMVADMLKGFLPVFFIAINYFHFSPIYVSAIGMAAIIGHSFSIFFGFKQFGKSVATTCGVIAAIDWRVALIGFVIWFALKKMSGISAIGSLTAIVIVPVVAYLFHLNVVYIIFFIINAVFVIMLHRTNIIEIKEKIDHRIKKYNS